MNDIKNIIKFFEKNNGVILSPINPERNSVNKLTSKGDWEMWYIENSYTFVLVNKNDGDIIYTNIIPEMMNTMYMDINNEKFLMSIGYVDESTGVLYSAIMKQLPHCDSNQKFIDKLTNLHQLEQFVRHVKSFERYQSIIHEKIRNVDIICHEFDENVEISGDLLTYTRKYYYRFISAVTKQMVDEYVRDCGIQYDERDKVTIIPKNEGLRQWTITIVSFYKNLPNGRIIKLLI